LLVRWVTLAVCSMYWMKASASDWSEQFLNTTRLLPPAKVSSFPAGPLGIKAVPISDLMDALSARIACKSQDPPTIMAISPRAKAESAFEPCQLSALAGERWY